MEKLGTDDPSLHSLAYLYNCRRGEVRGPWGAAWRLSGDSGLTLRFRQLADDGEVIVGDGKPPISSKEDPPYRFTWTLAHRTGTPPLSSQFVTVIEASEADRPIVGLAWRLLRSHRGGVATLGYYFLLQLASLADRRGWRSIADRVRAHIPMPRLERGISSLLGCRYRFVITELGGAAVDIDNDHDYLAARERFDEWSHGQRALAEALVGRVSLPEIASDAGLTVLRDEGRR